MTTKYLQLRIHKLKCIQETQNRQNFLGIPLETDPDSIDLQPLIIDGGEGVIAQPPISFLGNQYRNGKEEIFSSPRIIAEIPIREDDIFPRRIQVSLNMAEKDDGGGFNELMSRVASTLSDKLSEEFGDELGDDVTSSEIYGKVNDVAKDFLAKLLNEIGKALGLGDDPFRPVDITIQLSKFSTTYSSGTQLAVFSEPNPEHKGKYILTYDWNLSSTPVLTDISIPAGVTSAALGSKEIKEGYLRPHQTYRFRKSVRRKHIQLPISIVLDGHQFRWLPTPFIFYGNKQE